MAKNTMAAPFACVIKKVSDLTLIHNEAVRIFKIQYFTFLSFWG